MSYELSQMNNILRVMNRVAEPTMEYFWRVIAVLFASSLVLNLYLILL